MNKKILFITTLSLFIFIVAALIFVFNKEKESSSTVKVATCPTFYESLNKLNNKSDYSIILTSSTGASLAMLRRGQVDYVLGGRILYPNEANFNQQIIGEGFSFLSQRNFSVYDYDLYSYPIYSDLSEDLLRENFGNLDYNIVDDVYDHLNENLVITSWENTDFSRAEIVHLLRVDGSKNIKSRLPIVFCYDKCQNEIVEDIKGVVN